MRNPLENLIARYISAFSEENSYWKNTAIIPSVKSSLLFLQRGVFFATKHILVFTSDIFMSTLSYDVGCFDIILIDYFNIELLI